ncbi:uncharacterized protein PAC_17804 [Phialocephala subalpina]|uniref:Uncharacterized protein n=1 Tax=Phialocephala subalpina TaxID=576137 RepID=A0A1L7XSD8_9HELO|nr:uncharacterized protein PAC_17804 [Phialocephala subalpina]
MLCQYCEGITLETLIHLNKEDQKYEFHTLRDFATIEYYSHYLTFDSLIIAAQQGCDFCAAIYTEFRVANLLKDVAEKKEELEHSDRVYHIMAGVGFVGDEDELWRDGGSTGNELDIELHDADNQTTVHASDESSDDDSVGKQKIIENESDVSDIDLNHNPSDGEQEPIDHAMGSSSSADEVKLK